jgi:hypothetical protein
MNKERLNHLSKSLVLLFNFTFNKNKAEKEEVGNGNERKRKTSTKTRRNPPGFQKKEIGLKAAQHRFCQKNEFK